MISQLHDRVAFHNLGLDTKDIKTAAYSTTLRAPHTESVSGPRDDVPGPSKSRPRLSFTLSVSRGKELYRVAGI
jgi:hypothetical protein